MKYIIEGGKKLKGEITLSGNKNAVLPCMAAALLTDEEIVLENAPDIADVHSLGSIMQDIGISVKRDKGNLIIRAREIATTHLPKDLMGRLRASILLVGPLLARKGRVKFYQPGGCVIGKRSIDTHLQGLEDLGASVNMDESGEFQLSFSANQNSVAGDIFLYEPSVTATENAVLASVLGRGSVVIRNCAHEPHIVDLCRLLTLMGAKIEGIGTDTLTITRVDKLFGTKFSIRLDYMELGTYAIAAAVTNGEVTVKGLDDTDLDAILVHLKRFGMKFERKADSLKVSADKLTGVESLKPNIWPGFPADLMSPTIVLATQAHGVTLCHDWMYETRMFFVDKLITMGANITIADPHRVLVYGPTPLKGKELETPDIRAGMALVLAALTAEGRSVINRAELIERGYEDVVGKLKKLGADIRKEEV